MSATQSPEYVALKSTKLAIKFGGKHTVNTMTLIHQQQQFGMKITDNGHGIDPAHKAQVVERYYQEGI